MGICCWPLNGAHDRRSARALSKSMGWGQRAGERQPGCTDWLCWSAMERTTRATRDQMLWRAREMRPPGERTNQGAPTRQSGRSLHSPPHTPGYRTPPPCSREPLNKWRQTSSALLCFRRQLTSTAGEWRRSPPDWPNVNHVAAFEYGNESGASSREHLSFTCNPGGQQGPRALESLGTGGGGACNAHREASQFVMIYDFVRPSALASSRARTESALETCNSSGSSRVKQALLCQPHSSAPATAARSLSRNCFAEAN